MIPCELMAIELLPTVRRQTAMFLSSKGMSQREIARIIDTSESAVSQYISKKRGKHRNELEKLVRDYISRHYDTGKSFSANVCSLCMFLRKNGKMCYVHKLTSKISESKCDECSMG